MIFITTNQQWLHIKYEYLRIQASHLSHPLKASFICCCCPQCCGSSGNDHFDLCMVWVQLLQPVHMLFGPSKKHSIHLLCTSFCCCCLGLCKSVFFGSLNVYVGLHHPFHCCHPQCLHQLHLLLPGTCASFICCQPQVYAWVSFVAALGVCTTSLEPVSFVASLGACATHFICCCSWCFWCPFHYLLPSVFARPTSLFAALGTVQPVSLFSSLGACARFIFCYPSVVQPVHFCLPLVVVPLSFATLGVCTAYFIFDAIGVTPPISFFASLGVCIASFICHPWCLCHQLHFLPLSVFVPVSKNKSMLCVITL